MKITEQNSKYNDLEKMSIHEMLISMNKEDQLVPLAVKQCIPIIEEFITKALEKMKKWWPFILYRCRDKWKTWNCGRK